MNRLESTLDAVLHLLDRQVLDDEGLMVCKVDDLEINESTTGVLTVSALLAGAPALVPRWSGHIGRTLAELWANLGVEQDRWQCPWRIPLSLVDRLDSAVHLSAARDGLLVKQGDAPEGDTRRRLDHLLGMFVEHDGERLGRVHDVRLETTNAGIVCVALVVGRGRRGARLGYDRNHDMGPAVLSRAFRRLHRHTGQVAMDDIERIDWEQGQIRVRARATSLTHPSAS